MCEGASKWYSLIRHWWYISILNGTLWTLSYIGKKAPLLLGSCVHDQNKYMQNSLDDLPKSRVSDLHAPHKRLCGACGSETLDLGMYIQFIQIKSYRFFFWFYEANMFFTNNFNIHCINALVLNHGMVDLSFHLVINLCTLGVCEKCKKRDNS